MVSGPAGAAPKVIASAPFLSLCDAAVVAADAAAVTTDAAAVLTKESGGVATGVPAAGVRGG